MDNEVLIHVRVKNDGKIGFESFAKDADVNAKTISTSFATKLTENIKVKFTEQMPKIFGAGTGAAAPDQAGGVWGRFFGKAAGESISTEVNERIRMDVNGRWRDAFTGRSAKGGEGGRGGRGGDAHVDVNVDKQSLFSRLFNAGQQGAASFVEGFKSNVGGFFSGDVISLIIKSISIAALGAALSAVIGAALTTAVGLALGGGVIGLGIVAAFKDPRIIQQVQFLKDDIGKAFSGFGEHFVIPLVHFFDGLHGVFAQLQPMIEHIGEVFGPVADKLGAGIIGFLQNALPGIARATEASAPLIQTLADKLPGIGDAIGRFFDHIKNGMPDANQFFSDLLAVIPRVIRILGILIEAFTHFYSFVRYTFLTLANMAATWALATAEAARFAFGWVPGLGPKLDTAVRKAADFRNKINKQLSGIDDVDITVRIRTVGLAAAQAAADLARYMKNHGGKASGGVVGAAASGGMRSNLTMVGEHGPELVDLPPGTQVHSNPDSMRMLAAAGPGSDRPIIVQLVVDGRVLAQQLVEPTRELVRSLGRGSVQTFYGVPGAA